jgi:hypothetical protein
MEDIEMRLKVSFGRTINLGNYESARFDAGLEIDIEVDEYQDARKSYMGELQDFIDSKVEELKGDFLEPEENVIPEKESTKKKKAVRKVSPGFGGSAPVKESIEAPIFKVTAKAVGIQGEGNLIAWIPKKAIENLDKIVVNEGDIVELQLASWFTLEWKEDIY